MQELYECWELIIHEIAKEILLRHFALAEKLPLSDSMVQKLAAMLTPTELASTRDLASGATSSEIRVYATGILTEEEISSVLGTAMPVEEQKTIEEDDLEPGKRRAPVEDEAESTSDEGSIEGSEDEGDSEDDD